MLSGYPDYGKAPPEYLLTIVDVMAHYPAEMQVRMADPFNGIPGRTKFLPTAADFAEFAASCKAKSEQFRPAHTAYRKLEPDPEISKEERARVAVRMKALREKLVREAPDNLGMSRYDKRIAAQREKTSDEALPGELAKMKERWAHMEDLNDADARAESVERIKKALEWPR